MIKPLTVAVLCETAYVDATYALHTAWEHSERDMWEDDSHYATWVAMFDAKLAQGQCDRGERPRADVAARLVRFQ